jgi:hypothetical protein
LLLLLLDLLVARVVLPPPPLLLPLLNAKREDAFTEEDFQRCNFDSLCEKNERGVIECF